MNEALKWIGGTSAVAVVLLGAAVIAGHSLEAEQAAPEVRIELPPAAAPAPALVDAAVAAPRTEPFVIQRILPIEGAIRYGEWHWDEDGAPADGPIVVTVDLEARVISVFRAGYEIGAAAVLLGTPQHPTPTGVFPILSKERHNVSEIYGNAPMPWTLRLTHDGVAIHGGSTVEPGWASHGCIGTPDPFAARLFEVAGKGDRVIITRGKKAAIGTPLAAL